MRAPPLVLLALVIGSHAYALTTFDIGHALPLQLSDLAGFVAIYALWSHRPWAYSLIYYWGLTLSVQALVTPALDGSDFPSIAFQAFWWVKIATVWVPIYLTCRRLGVDDLALGQSDPSIPRSGQAVSLV